MICSYRDLRNPPKKNKPKTDESSTEEVKNVI
jgi:hypothetical protein